MKIYNKKEIKLLNIQIGCVLRYARLEKGLSQHELALLMDTNPTMIGRIERSENVSSWDKIFSLSQQLDIKFCKLFTLKEKDQLLLLIEKSYELEEKLTGEKKNYYNHLKKRIEEEY